MEFPPADERQIPAQAPYSGFAERKPPACFHWNKTKIQGILTLERYAVLAL